MCGIVGILTAEASVDPLVLQRMNDSLAHRGPDGEGFLLASGCLTDLRHAFHRRADRADGPAHVRVGLGHRRLAILDLSERGLQPMSTADGQAWIVFNGEIYNFQDIASQLGSKGYRFQTRTDTEVLLYAYMEWGEECLERLDGMFAFAVWDARRRRLFCARDRLGIKPFYYAEVKGHLIFASEIKALLAFPGYSAEPDDAAAVAFLVHGNCDYAERTLFRNIRALPAAHALTVEGGDLRVSVRRYWKLEPAHLNGRSDADQIAEVRQTLTATVKSHLISDVRIGSCLSGGLDSSTVVGLIGEIWREDRQAASAIGDRFDTFTSCYSNAAFDEREYALRMVQSVGATPHLVFPTPEDFWNDFGRMAWHQDMPFGMLNFYSQWRVMRAAREADVKVLLDGQGGDEVFGGYAKFRYAYLASLLRSGRLAAFTRESAGMVRNGDRYVLDVRNGARYLPARLRRLLNVDSLARRVVRGDWMRAVRDEGTPATRWWRHASQKPRATDATLVQQIQMEDISTDTLPQLLRMEDRSSMAFSIEARVPLLDHRVVTLGLSLPDHLKFNRGRSKFAVRAAMGGVIPEPVRWRTTKLGFAAPNRQWLAQELRTSVTELLEDDLRCRKYVDVETLRSWYRSPESHTANTESLIGLFRVLSVEMWMRAFALA